MNAEYTPETLRWYVNNACLKKWFSHIIIPSLLGLHQFSAQFYLLPITSRVACPVPARWHLPHWGCEIHCGCLKFNLSVAQHQYDAPKFVFSSIAQYCTDNNLLNLTENPTEISQTRQLTQSCPRQHVCFSSHLSHTIGPIQFILSKPKPVSDSGFAAIIEWQNRPYQDPMMTNMNTDIWLRQRFCHIKSLTLALSYAYVMFIITKCNIGPSCSWINATHG